MTGSRRKRRYASVTREAVKLLGNLIRLCRADRGLTAQEFADRAGISRTTLHRIENRALSPEIGVAFEVAMLVGVQLFETEPMVAGLVIKRGERLLFNYEVR